jgi:hypothetical protein
MNRLLPLGRQPAVSTRPPEPIDNIRSKPAYNGQLRSDPETPSHLGDGISQPVNGGA